MRPFLLFVALLCPALASAATCTQPPALDGDGARWTGWGNGYGNTRQADGSIDSTNLDTLELRWAYGFAGAGSVVGNPVVHNDVLYIGVDSGEVHALDARSGCTYWIFTSPSGGVRTAPALAQVDGRWLLWFGSRGAEVFAVDALTGQQVWRTKVEMHPAAILTGSPQFVMLEGRNPARLLVPVSSSEEGMAAVPTYACCTFRGSVVALDALSGAQIWKRDMIATPAADTGDNKRGPSGAAIWSAPTIDPANARMFVTTGDAYSAPADEATDAVVAMNLDDGARQWLHQGTANDIWTVACMRPNAAEDCGPDQDYGAPGMLVTQGDTPLLVAGQKSGVVRAFDPASGALRWETALVENTNEFGGKIIWGGASDGTKVYFGLGVGGIHALDVADGGKAWFTPLQPAAGRERNLGQDGPLTVSADLVVSSGWDGVVRALDTNSGAVLWEFDTAREYADTINGVPAKGGSMGAAGPVIAGGRLFVPSGCVGVKNGIGGNVLLMFAPGAR
ncbi:MAG: PQQ-binding-like beta-propeller repeat protein [Gammaproteobacteria bacterium]